MDFAQSFTSYGLSSSSGIFVSTLDASITRAKMNSDAHTAQQYRKFAQIPFINKLSQRLSGITLPHHRFQASQPLNLGNSIKTRAVNIRSRIVPSKAFLFVAWRKTGNMTAYTNEYLGGAAISWRNETGKERIIGRKRWGKMYISKRKERQE